MSVPVAPAGRGGEAARIVIDTDPGIDDAAAILLALASPELCVLGLTTVAGNAPLELTTRNALRVLELAGATGVPVAAGAERALVVPLRRVPGQHSVHGDDGLGGVLRGAATLAPADLHAADLHAADLHAVDLHAVDLHAVDLLAATAAEAPITVVAIGPLTNVALLLAMHPGIEQRIERLVVMGGARREGNVTAAAEFNIWADPEAAARVLGAGIPLTLLPLDVTHQALLGPTELDALAAGGSVGASLAEMIRRYAATHRPAYGEDFAPLHDVLAVLALVCPEAIGFEAGSVGVDTGWSASRGATLVDTRPAGGARPALVGADLDRTAFARLLLERIGALDERLRAGAGAR